MKIDRFNVRVYFLITGPEGLLVSDEILRGTHCTKLPGGGLEFGEGTVACCEREAREELGQEIEVLSHHFTTDVFIQSRFRENEQVLAIYYKARLKEAVAFRLGARPFDFLEGKEGEESFRWLPWENVKESEFAFPTDRRAISELLKERNPDVS